jgi:hypothetical protein
VWLLLPVLIIISEPYVFSIKIRGDRAASRGYLLIYLLCLLIIVLNYPVVVVVVAGAAGGQIEVKGIINLPGTKVALT